MEALIALPVDAVGLNFIPWSKRRVDVELAKTLARLAKGRLEVIGVVADLTEPSIRELAAAVGLDAVQLHGTEPPSLLESLGTLAYKAVGIATADDVAAAVATVGGRLLVDTKTGPQVGGTGKTFDWRLVEQLCRTRNVILAGGLHPDNIGVALEQLRPYGVDVASGVEAPARPGVKDMHLVRRFIEVIRELDARIDDHA